MHANISAHTGRQLKRKRRQVTYLLLLWVQPCVYFYSFHMHSPSSPFILSSLLREETHQLMFSFTVIGWFKAASVNCAPPLPSLPTALHLHSAILFQFLTFFVYFGSLYFFPSKQVMSRASVSAGWYCEWGDVVWLFPVLMNFAWGILKKSTSGSKSSANTFGDIKACVDKKNKLPVLKIHCLTHVTLWCLK